MLQILKTYTSDCFINIAAQFFILLSGFYALLCGTFVFICWAIVVIGYAIVLANMEQFCEKRKGADFKHYYVLVLLPANMIALAVSCYYFVFSASAGYLNGNLIFGLVILAGSLAITLISAVYNRVALHQE